MKKLLLIGAVAAIGYVVYRQVAANQAEEDLWNDATSTVRDTETAVKDAKVVASDVNQVREDAAKAFGGKVDDPRQDAAEAFGGKIEN
ncbi:MAG: DLW-39 family protein [Candidatus Nanopelagicales bacterium]